MRTAEISSRERSAKLEIVVGERSGDEDREKRASASKSMCVPNARVVSVSVAEILRTRRGRHLAFVTVAGLTLILSRSALARAPTKFLVPGQPWSPQRVRPGSLPQIALFSQAAAIAGVPTDWAADPNLITLLRRESNGWVGIPNYQYGERATDKSRWPEVWAELRQPSYVCPKSVPGVQGRFTCATGLGQLIPTNVDQFYPDGRAGIGDPLNEAVGMLKYIQKRYQTPMAAKTFWDEHRWY